MKQSPSCKADSSLAGQEILCFLGNLKIHYNIHNSPPPVSIQGQINTVNSYFFNIHFNTVLPLIPSLPSGLFPSCFPTKTPYAFLLPPHITTPHSQPASFGNQNIIWWKLKSTKLFTGQFCPVSPSPKPEQLPCHAVGTHWTKTAFNVDITVQTRSVFVWPVTKWIRHAILTNDTPANHNSHSISSTLIRRATLHTIINMHWSGILPNL